MRGRPARSVVVPWSRALAAGVAALCAGAPLLAQFHEDVVVERVRWPVRLTVDHDVPPGACLSPASVRVTEDGASSEVVGVESDDEPVLHVVLLDASGSMEGNQGFATAVRLLREYIDAAPAGDRFALFTFDQDLVLRVKPLTMVSSRRSSALVSGLEDLPLTNGTSLRDDVRFLCDYLSDLPGTKSVLVLTDGLDNESGATPEFVRNVIGAATAMDVTWWTVVVGAGSGAISKKPEAVAGRSFIRAIAEQSGGAFFDAETSGPSQVARHILEQLRHRAYVVYRSSRPPPGPRAPTEARRVRVLSQRSGCRFSADREERCAGECGMTLAPRERGDDPSMAGARGHRLRLPPEFAPFADRVSIEAGAGLVSGSTLDVVRDPMELYPDAAFDPKHVDPPTIFPAPEYALKSFRLQVPPLSALLSDRRSLEEVVLDHLRSGGDLDLVNGRTLLWMRSQLASAVYSGFPDYRAWAGERIARDLRARLQAELPAPVGEPERVAREKQVELAVAAYLEHPPDSELTRHLGVWIEDVSACELASRVAATLGREIIQSGPSNRRATAEEAERIWARLRDELGPPTRVRIVAPLRLIYDETSESIGFDRIVLPRPVYGARPRDEIPANPSGLRIARWLAERSDGEPELASLFARSRLVALRTAELAPPRSAVQLPPIRDRVEMRFEDGSTLDAVVDRTADESTPECVASTGALAAIVTRLGVSRCAGSHGHKER